MPRKRERCLSPLGHIAESLFDYALKQRLSSLMGVSSLNSRSDPRRDLVLISEG